MRRFLNDQLKIKKNGFTLIELVTVLIILGILAVTVAPKLTEKMSFEDYTVRDQLITRLRLVQLQGMNVEPFDSKKGRSVEAEQFCHWVVVKPSCFYHEKTLKIEQTCNKPSAVNICASEVYNEFNKVAFANNMLKIANYRFNIDGTLNNDSTISPAPFSIKLNGDNHLSIAIEQEGYIHGTLQK